MGWTDKVFEVIDWSLSTRNVNGAPLFIVNLVLQETASAVYDWNSGEETTVDPAPDSQLPSALNVDPPTALNVTPREVETASGDLTYEFDIDWTAPNDRFVTNGGHYEVEFKKSSDSNWRTSYQAKDSDIEIRVPQVRPGINYDTRVRSINNVGVRSQWQPLFGFSIDSPSGATISLDYGQITGSVTDVRDFGQITGSVDSTEDYGSLV
jgi:hypothetical protein